MKQIILLLSLVLIIISANAQEAPPQVPPKKNMMVTKLTTLPKQLVKLPLGKELPTLAYLETAKFTRFNWQLTRWWVTTTAGHSITDPSFKFLTNGTVSCSLSTPEAATRLESGTYTIRGNNMVILLRKDADVIMTCNLVQLLTHSQVMHLVR